jgi:hypothetical protein
MMKVLSIAAIALMIAGSSAFACGCDKDADKDSDKDSSKKASTEQSA